MGVAELICSYPSLVSDSLGRIPCKSKSTLLCEYTVTQYMGVIHSCYSCQNPFTWNKYHSIPPTDVESGTKSSEEIRRDCSNSRGSNSEALSARECFLCIKLKVQVLTAKRILLIFLLLFSNPLSDSTNLLIITSENAQISR